MVTITTKVKIPTIPEIIETLQVFRKAMQFCIDTAWENKIKNNIKLHPLVYRQLKTMGLPSQMAISCIKQSCGIVKKAKSKPLIKKCSIKYNFPRNASIKGNLLSISTIKGRVKLPFCIPKCYSKYFSWDISESLLRMDSKGRTYFLFNFSKDIPIAKGNSSLGIDLGINNLAVCSDRRFFKVPQAKNIKRKFQFLRGKLQAKGTRSAKRLLKKISGKERRFMAWINHNISKQVVSTNADTIVMENLKGIRKQNRGKRMNRWISNWSFFQLQSFIKYKAELLGKSVAYVKPAYTSQTCSKCGQIGVRSKGFFVCHCGYSLNADLNASINIAKGKSLCNRLPVTQPNIQANELEGSLRTTDSEVMDKSHRL